MAERETSLAERERKDAEKAAEIKARQVRLGHVSSTPEDPAKEVEPGPVGPASTGNDTPPKPRRRVTKRTK